MIFSTRTGYPAVEMYMWSCIYDSAHDTEHIYRVLNYALDIVKYESDEINIELLTIACLLHDIGRPEQFSNSNIDHASCGADKAYKWLLNNGYKDDFAYAVKNCIKTHRFRSGGVPQTLEAKILFDADKLDACGAVGIARTLLHKSNTLEILYSLNENGEISDGSNDTQQSFLQEYKYKLEKVYDRFYTERGIELAAKRKSRAETFYHNILSEVRECYSNVNSY